jgi:hypothetical protein
MAGLTGASREEWSRLREPRAEQELQGREDQEAHAAILLRTGTWRRCWRLAAALGCGIAGELFERE